MNLNAPAVYAAYLAGYLGLPIADIVPALSADEVALEDLAPFLAFALGERRRALVVDRPEPEGLAAIVGKVRAMLAPPVSADGA
jgi:hypothetical protein